MLVWMQRQTGM